VATPKYVGVETEFGIAVDSPNDVNPVLASWLVVAECMGGVAPPAVRGVECAPMRRFGLLLSCRGEVR
jgi:hypothetical protein